jgi:phytol kinase
MFPPLPDLPVTPSFATLRETFATACVLAISHALLLLVSALRARLRYGPETKRKLLHLGVGLVSLSYPFVFTSPLPVILINAAFICLLLLGRRHEPLRRRWHDLTSRVDRQTVGEFYFPLSIALLFLLTRNAPLLFCVPVLILTISDAAAALIGTRYGLHPYRTAAGHKTLEGSAAFFLCTFLLTQLPLGLFTPLSPTTAILIAATLAVCMTLVEALSWGGLDNLLLPLVSFALLSLLLRASA